MNDLPMNDQSTRDLIERLIAEEITPEQHAQLQTILKADPTARDYLRSRIDLESSLKTWATETPPTPLGPKEESLHEIKSDTKSKFRPLWLAAALAITFAVIPTALSYLMSDRTNDRVAEGESVVEEMATFLGTIQQQTDCVWKNQSAIAGDRFSTGTLCLTSGLAELNFHSGTKVVLQAPCELTVVSPTSARLLAGSVFANVSELSDSFTLHTPELTILNEGTEFAVAIDDESTEIHVFEGSVTWKPIEDKATEPIEQIVAGQARQIMRSRDRIRRSNRIPFESRRFKRRLQAALLATAGESLLAYDGFENPAGRIRAAKSGIGWAQGWGNQGGTNLPTIITAPDDEVFGISRAGQQILELKNHDAIRRRFESNISVSPDHSIYVGCMITCPSQPNMAEVDQLLRIALVPIEAQRAGGPQRRNGRLAFGVTEDGLPYIKSGGQISPSAPAIVAGTVYFAVLRVQQTPAGIEPSLRFFHQGESLPEIEPTIWTVKGNLIPKEIDARALHLSVGRNATWHIDELKIGTTWQSVLPIVSK